MDDKSKKILTYVIIGILLFISGIGVGINICNRRIPDDDTIKFEQDLDQKRAEIAELKRSLESAKSQLERLKIELGQHQDRITEYQDQLGSISAGIEDSLVTVGRTGQLAESIGATVSELGNASGGFGEILNQLRINHYKLKASVGELQSENTRLAEELRKLQESIRE